MIIGETLEAGSRLEFREWLAQYHHEKPEIWLLIYKKSSGKQASPSEMLSKRPSATGGSTAMKNRSIPNAMPCGFHPAAPAAAGQTGTAAQH